MKILSKTSKVYCGYYFPTGEWFLLNSKPKKKDLKAMICNLFDYSDEDVFSDEFEVTRVSIYTKI